MICPRSENACALLRHAPLGLHLNESYQVVLAGRPNVGKSSLINALVGYERAIVCDSPGTTRDIVTAETAIDGWPVQFSDTAGLRTTVDPLEEAGVRRRKRIADCDLVVLVFDASKAEQREDLLLREEFPAALVVRNKCDLASERLPTSGSEENGPLATSAVTGEGIGELLRSISRRLVAEPPPADAAVPFTQAQVEAISRALAALEQDDVSRAIAFLRSLAAPQD